jgi:hypothetical protein
MSLSTVTAPRVESRNGAGRRTATLVAAALLAGVAAIHAAVAPAHLREWLPAGGFFIVVAAGQASLALMLFRRPTQPALLASIWSSVAVVGVYVWSRTAGLPFAPVEHGGHAGHEATASQAGHAVGGRGNGVPVYPGTVKPTSAEPVGALDLLALCAELAVIALLVFLLAGRHRRWTGNAILVCGLGMLALRATAVLT